MLGEKREREKREGGGGGGGRVREELNLNLGKRVQIGSRQVQPILYNVTMHIRVAFGNGKFRDQKTS